MKWVVTILVIFTMILPQANVLADGYTPLGQVIITEVSPGSLANAKQEFIELYNSTNTVMDFTAANWAVQVASSTAKDWKSPLRTIFLTGFLYPGMHYLIGSTYTENNQAVTFPEGADVYYAAALSASSGHVRIVHAPDGEGLTAQNAIVSDQLEWLSGTALAIDSANPLALTKALPIGNSLQRQTDLTGVPITSGNNATDFVLSASPTPQTDTASQPVPVDEPDPTESDPSDPLATPDPPLPTTEDTHLPPQITELLPNPASPALDAQDEFIEIYNPDVAPVNIKGFSLTTGLTTQHTYTFTADTVLQPNEYKAFYAKQTKLSLSNTGSQVKLTNPSGEIVSQTAPYRDAADGLSWQYLDGAWAWSSKPTPAAGNEYIVPLAALKALSAPAQKPTAPVAKPKTTKAPAKAATKKAAATKAPAKKANKVTTVTTQLAADKTSQSGTVIHTAILAGVLSLTLLYGAYEYRHDLVGKIKQLASYRSYWRKARQPFARWRNNRAGG